jgi:hypothetical protein
MVEKEKRKKRRKKKKQLDPATQVYIQKKNLNTL